MTARELRFLYEELGYKVADYLDGEEFELDEALLLLSESILFNDGYSIHAFSPTLEFHQIQPSQNLEQAYTILRDMVVRDNLKLVLTFEDASILLQLSSEEESLGRRITLSDSYILASSIMDALMDFYRTEGVL